jgi:hypothetical protein
MKTKFVVCYEMTGEYLSQLNCWTDRIEGAHLFGSRENAFAAADCHGYFSATNFDVRLVKIENDKIDIQGRVCRGQD